MKNLLLILFVLICAGTANAQFKTFTPTCAGTNDTTAFSALITTISTTNARIVIPRLTTPCAVNSLTIPANVTLDFTDGGQLKINTGQTLTVVGKIDAGPARIFTNALASQGTVVFTGNTTLNSVYPQWWGAVGDGTTDDLPSFKATITAAPAGGTVLLPKPSSYYLLTLGTYVTVGENIPVTKNLNIVGLSPDAKIKVGPESAAIGSYILFATASTVTLRAENFTLEGPTVVPPGNDGTTNRQFRAFWHNGTSGGVFIKRMISSGFGEFVKSQSATVLGGNVIDVQDSDISTKCDECNADTFLIENKNSFYFRRSKGTNLSVSSTSATTAYIMYIYEESNALIQDSDIGDTDGNAIIFYGGVGVTPPDFVVLDNVRFKGTYTIGSTEYKAVMTSGLHVTDFINCTWNLSSSARAIHVRNGGANINGGYINSNGGGIEAEAANYVSELNVTGMTFINARVNNSLTTANAANDWRFDNCDFIATGAIGSSALITFSQLGGYIKVTNSTFRGAMPGAPQFWILAGEAYLENNRFLNASGTKAIQSQTGAEAPTVTSKENYFLTTADAFNFAAAPTAANLIPRRAVQEATIASGSTITGNWNFDTYRVTGSTTVNTITLTGAPSIANIGPVRIIPDTSATWAFGSSGNVTAAAGARTVNQVSILQYIGARAKWLEPQTSVGGAQTTFSPISDTSANFFAAVTNEIGSGSVVGSTNPVFTAASLGTSYLSTTKTAGTTGVTANLLVSLNSSGNVIDAATNDVGVLGIAVTTATSGNPVEVATRGIINCIAAGTISNGDLLVPDNVTAGRCRDIGQTNATAVASNVQIIGRAISGATVGNPVSVQLYGPGHFGTSEAALATVFTNKTYDAAATGNVFTSTFKTWIGAAACNNATAFPMWDLPTATPAVAACITGTNIQKGVLDFADTSGGFSAQNTFLLPADWSGAIDLKLIWITTATAGNVKWSLSTICTATDATETDDPAFNTASTVTAPAPGTASRVQASSIASLTVTGCAAGELLHLKIFRDGADAADTLAATARLIGIELSTTRQQ